MNWSKNEGQIDKLNKSFFPKDNVEKIYDKTIGKFPIQYFTTREDRKIKVRSEKYQQFKFVRFFKN